MLETDTMVQLKKGRWRPRRNYLMMLMMMENEHLPLIELSILNVFLFSLFWTLNLRLKNLCIIFKDLIYISSFLEALNFDATYS